LSFLGAPMCISRPYFGKAPWSLRAAVSMTDETKHQEQYYVDDTMRDEMYIEPFTGKPLLAHKHVQVNYYIDKATLDGSLYANLFTGHTDDAFVWPAALSMDAIGITTAELADEVTSMGVVYTMMLACLIVGIGVGILALLCAAYLVRDIRIAS